MVVYGARGLTDKKQAYGLLERAARECWGMECLPELARHPGGKPYFVGSEDRQFNLSHSGDLALCAVSGEAVGVDVQVVKSWRPALVNRVCSAEEREWLETRKDADRGFALLWALKECRVKYEGRGIVGTGEMIRGIRVPLPQKLDGEMQLDGLFFRCYEGEEWMAAVCGTIPPPGEIGWADFEEQS